MPELLSAIQDDRHAVTNVAGVITLDGEGRSTMRHVESQASSGMHVYEAQILASSGERFDRTRRKTAVLVTGKPKVLVVTLFGDEPTLLVDAIRQSEADVEHLQLTNGRLEPDRLSEVDLVVLSDLPLERAGEVSLVSGLSTQAQDALVEFVRDHGVTYSFGSPAIWGRVARHCQAEGVRLPSLRRVLMAGAPVPPALHEALLGEVLSSQANTHTPYGATEALPVATITGRALAETFAATRQGAGACVGAPLPTPSN